MNSVGNCVTLKAAFKEKVRQIRLNYYYNFSRKCPLKSKTIFVVGSIVKRNPKNGQLAKKEARLQASIDRFIIFE
jgi:hypothetical protein